jgi:predicted RNA polymerase sigma factor
MAATLERRGAFEEFYRAERTTVLRALAFELDDVDLAAEAVDEALARA